VSVRIEDIVERIRREIAAEVEGRPSDPSAPIDDHLPPISARPELEHLNRNWRLFEADPDIRSHRRLLGPIVVRLKRIFRRLVFSGLEKEKLFLSELVRFQNALAVRTDRLLREVTERTKAVADRNDLFLGAFDVRLEALEAREQMRRAMGDASPSAASDVADADEAMLAEMATALGGGLSERIGPFVERLRSVGSLVVIGCGDGEIFAALNGIRVSAVEASAALVAECRSRGLAVELASLGSHLESLPEASVGGLIFTRTVDRHPVVRWPRLVAGAWRALRPGGIAVFEGLVDDGAAARLRWLMARQRFAILDDRDVSGAAGAREHVIAGERRDPA
jgi:Methionine biosynthesis protein MetW